MTSSKSSQTLDAKTVRQLADILNETNLTEIEYELGEAKIRVARQVISAPAVAQVQGPAMPIAAAAAPQPAPAEAAAPAPTASDPAKHPGAIKSPMVGNAYMSPAPGADAFVNVGDSVKAGDSVLIIEAMKVMNQIKAPKDGIVKEILVKDGDPVEYDEVLMIIE